MVHRAADSRLLASLLSTEKDYSKHIDALLDSSHASLTSLTAYASASPPPASQVILAVAGTLASADDALRRYAASVEEWRDYLKDLKNLEDEVGNITRDREILVTRLIKASKSTPKPSSNRDSGTQSPAIRPIAQAFRSSSTLSLKSDDALTNSYTPSPSFSNPSNYQTPATKKLQAAQAELQACEAHLALKERELDFKRSGAIKDGLTVRCRALAECGQRWFDLGRDVGDVLTRENDRQQQLQESRPRSHHRNLSDSQIRSPSPSLNKPLPGLDNNPARPSSDLSSIAPSQSASQMDFFITQPTPSPNSAPPEFIGAPSRSSHIYGDLEATSQDSSDQHMTMQIPAAHAISDVGLPTSKPSSPGPAPPSSFTSLGNGDPSHSGSYLKHILARRITEEDLGLRAGSMSGEGAYTPGGENEDGGSSDDEDESAVGQVQMVENPRFNAASSSSKRLPLATASPTKKRFEDKNPKPSYASGPPSTNSTGSGSRFFGSIRGLFTRKVSSSNTNTSDRGEPEEDKDHGRGRTKKSKGWETRTDKNLKKLHVRGGGGSDDEGITSMSTPMHIPSPLIPPRFPDTPTSSPRKRVMSDATATPASPGKGSRRLKKRGAGDPGAGEPVKRRRSASLGPGVKVQPETQDAGIVDLSDWRASRAEEWAEQQREVEAQKASTSNARADETHMEPVGTPTVKKKKSNRKTMPARAPGPSAEGQRLFDAAPASNLSRNSSMTSAKSAPVTPHRRATSGVPPLPSHISPSSSSATITQKSSVDDGSGTKSKAERRGSHPAANAGMGASTSLMSIVEDVARANREGWKAHNDNDGRGGSVRSIGGSIKPIGMMEVVKAPPSMGRKGLLEASTPNAVNRNTSSASNNTASAFDIPKAPGSVFDTDRTGLGASASAPSLVPETAGSATPRPKMVKAPLRSAMRNSSRSPSPALSATASAPHFPAPMPAPLPPPPRAPPPMNLNGISKSISGQGNDSDDAASISSYETVNESAGEGGNDTETEREKSHPLPPVPPKEQAQVHTSYQAPLVSALSTHHYIDQLRSDLGGSDLSTSTASTETPTTGPRRRKSVRVSLQPTFSPTPPAIDDDEDEEQHPTWSGGRDREPEGAKDMWEDSSDEDVEYQRAKRLLTRISRKEKKGGH